MGKYTIADMQANPGAFDIKTDGTIIKKADEPGPAPVITEAQRQGMKIANMAVKNWGARITLSTTVSISRYDLDDPQRFSQVIKEMEYQVDGATAGGNDATIALLDELVQEIHDNLSDSATIKEVETFVQAALAGKETP